MRHVEEEVVRGIGRGECVIIIDAHSPDPLHESFCKGLTNFYTIGEDYPEHGQPWLQLPVRGRSQKNTRDTSSDSMFPDSRDEIL